LVRTLADGTHLTRPTGRETVTYRDSSGRIRTERPFFRGTTSTAPFALIEVQDPVAGYAWMLDYVNRIAHRVPAKLRSATAELPPGYTTPERSTLPDGTTQASEPLSTKTMFGVTVVGVKTTATSPAGSGLGNDRPVTTVSEDWMSPQVGLVIYSRYSRPGGDESTRTLKDLSTAEPDPSLFRIPPDYQIIDETGSFTMKVSLQN
jgi:hypothetical protein